MKKRQFIQILRRYVEGKSTEEEGRLIETYYDLLLAKSKLESIKNGKRSKKPEKELLDRIWGEIHGKEGAKIKIAAWRKVWKAAAIIIVLLGTGAVIYTLKNREERSVTAAGSADKAATIKPGGNIAILTLANGKKVLLDSMPKGSLVQQGNISVIKLNNGQLAYQVAASDSRINGQVDYNTLSTPRGGQYEIVLPDGTKVWLNAASSLHYPVAFTGKTRTVGIKGEGYFEVAPDPQKPFIVKVGDREKIEVLGTRFNVNAYPDEGRIRTTLQDGSIRVTGNRKSVLLKPSEAVGLDRETGDMDVDKVNVNTVIAWKNGLFYFDNTNIKEIMSQISRWYNVSIAYDTENLEHKIYSGTLPRYSEVTALLKMLELTGTVHFKIEGRTITVLN